MDTRGAFCIKLYELEQQYGKLQSRLAMAQKEDDEILKKEIFELKKECEECDLLLDQRINGSQTKSVTDLAQVQKEYYHRVEQLKKKIIDDSEQMILYAEYAIDFATQSMRYALLDALQALEAQRKEKYTNRQ